MLSRVEKLVIDYHRGSVQRSAGAQSDTRPPRECIFISVAGGGESWALLLVGGVR